MTPLKRKTPEEKAAAEAEKQARKAALRSRFDAAREERKQEEKAKSSDQIRRTLQADETIEAEFRTAETLMKKDLFFTSKRLIIAPVHSQDLESIPYRSITGVRSSNFITKDLDLDVVGRRDSLKLIFSGETDRDRALAVLNTYAL